MSLLFHGIVVVAALLVALLSAASPAHAAREVRVGTYDYAPLISRDANGKPVGLYIELIEQIAAQNDWRLTYVHGIWDENRTWLETGRIDLVLDIAHTPQRAAQYSLNHNPVVPTWSQIDVRVGSKIATVHDLEGQRVAVNRGDVTTQATKELAAQWGVHPIFVVVDTAAEEFELLSRGEVAAAATDNIAGSVYQRKYRVIPSPILFAPFSTGFGTAKGRNLDLLAAVDRYIETQAGDPSSPYNATLDKWLETPPTMRERVPAYVIWILVGALSLAALLIGADALLRRQVRSKTEEIRRLNEDLERRVTARTIELQAALKELESFSYSVSHDLRAPLRALDGFSRMLLDDYGDKLDDDAHHYLERIRQGTQQMATLINGLLELSRLNRSEIERRPIDLSALAGAVIDDLRETEPQRRVDVVIADGLVASADPGLSRTLLANLIGNAWKFTARQATARIEVGAAEADGEPAYFVRDDGAGFDMAYAGKLFGAFQRLHGPDEFEGTGIGLATVQRIVRRHGGRVWAEAAVDKGATIFFTLPGPATNV